MKVLDFMLFVKFVQHFQKDRSDLHDIYIKNLLTRSITSLFLELHYLFQFKLSKIFNNTACYHATFKNLKQKPKLQCNLNFM